MKSYDLAYFDRWYRDPRHVERQRAFLRRQVALAVAMTEWVLERPIASVLDLGAGEGRWFRELRRVRPRIRYQGVEPSDEAVRKHGRRRNLLRGDFDSLHRLGIGGPWDLVVAADVLHYLPTAAMRRAVHAMAPFVGGLAFCPTFTGADAIEGDREGFHRRRAATYRRAFADAGLEQVAPWAWVPHGHAEELADLERPGEG